MFDQAKMLETIAALSVEFGGTDYVRGGGGNTSVKNGETIWIKPSGTALKDLTPETFLPVDRAKLGAVYEAKPPAESSARESMIKDLMAAAVLGSGRASVETPLHDSLSARYVVHTHAVRVNGMTCAKRGREVCARLFPDALWIEYIDPGYILCMHVREKIAEYREMHGREPSVIVLKNHGVFVAGETADEIRAIYADLIGKLTREYEKADVGLHFEIESAEDSDKINSACVTIKSVAGEANAGGMVAAKPFPVMQGPLTPDHIVYAKSYPLTGEPTPEKIEGYKKQYGYYPQIFVTDDAVIAIGASEKKAGLAMEMCEDGALVVQLAQAFGGVEFMSDAARLFIENWEVEAYRSQQVAS